MTSDRSRPFNYGRDQVISYPVTVGNIRTRVVESHGGSTPLVCLHGVGSRADRFIPAIPGLVARGFKVYAIDFPGHGFADKDSRIDYRPRGFAEFIAGVLDELELSDVIIAGTSLGGHVGARMACDRPDLVAGLVLIGTMGIASLNESDMVPPENVANGSESAIRSKLGFLVSDPEKVTDSWVREESKINSSTGAHQALLAAAGYVNFEANADIQGERLAAERPNLPIQIVWGTEDRWTPLEMGRRAKEVLPNAQFVEMEGCGHAPYFESPVEFANILSHFFKKESVR
ncbi:alpha/beta fold hydrolase [Rhodococcus sp. NPDC057529]|uniref:alpha/beta fold hydrolase n=1 Tax=Rhodococcus sp. NPDC057529 TaxID=3346158 RepID=UPI00366F355A